MKNNILKITILTFIIAGIASISSFASTIDADTYLKSAAAIKDDISELNTEIKAIRAENKTIQEKYQTIVKNYNKDKTLPISLDNFKKAQELYKTLPAKDDKEQNIDSETSVQTYVKNSEYDKALEKLQTNLSNKKDNLTFLKQKNAIWKQIDELIS